MLCTANYAIRIMNWVTDAQSGFTKLCADCYKKKCDTTYPFPHPDTTQLCKTFNSACVASSTCTLNEKCQIVSFVWQDLIRLNVYLDGWFGFFYSLTYKPDSIPDVPCVPPPSYADYWIGDCNEQTHLQYLQDALNYLKVKGNDTRLRFDDLFGRSPCTSPPPPRKKTSYWWIPLVIVASLCLILSLLREMERHRQPHRQDRQIQQQQRPLLNQQIQQNDKRNLQGKLQQIQGFVRTLRNNDARMRFLTIIHVFNTLLDPSHANLNIRGMWTAFRNQGLLCHPEASGGLRFIDHVGNFINLMERLQRMGTYEFLDSIDYRLCYEGVLRALDEHMAQFQRRKQHHVIPDHDPTKIPPFDDENFTPSDI